MSAVEYKVKEFDVGMHHWVITLDDAIIDTFPTEDEALQRCAEYNAEAGQ